MKQKAKPQGSLGRGSNKFPPLMRPLIALFLESSESCTLTTHAPTKGQLIRRMNGWGVPMRKMERKIGAVSPESLDIQSLSKKGAWER